MKQAGTLSGHELREMFAAATRWLEKSVSDIDALNVFPVPDGDTGTNMFLTMRSTIDEAYRVRDESASAVAQAMSQGALMGARGNSGVILSQIFRGLAQGIARESVSGNELADALSQASAAAYRSLTNPVEGTILTVMKDAARAAREASQRNGDVLSVMEAAVNAARESVGNTPTLLPVLREAGVVDAGGQGLYTILDGAYRYLKGEVKEMEYRKPLLVSSTVPLIVRSGRFTEHEAPYGYCTEFLIKGERLKPEKVRTRLSSKGQSLMVVGDPSTVRVHIHTEDPGGVIRYATLQGTLHQVSIRNMDEQHREFLQMQQSRMPEVDMAVIAVASGDGFVDVFRSLGAVAIVPGGQTMNPSTKELLQAVESVHAEKIILLPNDKNIIPTAQQLQALTQKKIAVVPAKTIPQGITALLALDYESDFRINVENMTRALAAVRTIAVTRAMRSAQLGGLTIRKRQFLGFLNGDLVAVADSPAQALDEAMGRLPINKAEVVTIYYGAETRQAEAEEISAAIIEKHPRLQVEVVRGGQPHYNYIVSIE